MSTLSRQMQEREIRRQIFYNRVRRTVLGAVPPSLPEYLRVLMGAVIGFGTLAELLRVFTDMNPVYVLAGVGLAFSLQITQHRYRLARDPDYVVRGCGCLGSDTDDTAAVLRSRESALLGIPNSVVGAVLYAALTLAVYMGQSEVAIGLAAVAVLGSAYLAYVMVVRLASLCPLCINVAALNLLLLVNLLR